MPFDTTPPPPALPQLRPFPQEVSPLETLAQMGEIRARNQQMQTAQLQQQQMRMELDRTKAVNQAYQNAMTPQPDGTFQLDPNKLTTSLAQNGHGEAIPGILENYTKYQQSVANLKETQQKVAAGEADAAGNFAATIKAANNDPNLFLAHLDDARSHGIIDDSHYAPLKKMVTDALTQDPTGAQARTVVGQLTDQMIAGSPKQQELQSARITAQARQQQADTAKTADQRKQADEDLIHGVATLGVAQPKSQAEYQQLVGQLPPAAAQRILSAVPVAQFDPATSMDKIRRLGMTPEQQTQADQAAANAKETARHNSVEESQGTQRIGIEQKRTNLQEQQLGFDTNGGISQTARMIAGGQIDPQTTRSMLRRSPGLLEQVKRADPNFDEATIDNRYNTLKEFNNTSVSKAGGQALALNTMIHHADLYMKTAEALKNGTFRPGNAAYNEVASVFGSAPPTNAALVARFFASETGKVATGGVPAEGEINGILKNLGTDASPEGIAGAGKTLLQLAAGRATPLMERVKDAKLDNQIHVIGPDAQEILQRRGFDPQTMKPQQGGPAGMPAVPASIPAELRKTAHYSPSTKLFYYTPDGGKTWQTAKP